MKKIKSKNMKGKSSKFKAKGKLKQDSKPIDKEVYNRADASLKDLIGNKGTLGNKVRWK